MPYFMGGFSGTLASVAILFMLIIVLAGVSVSVVNAPYQSPWGAFTVGLTIPIALLVGIYLKWLRPEHIGEANVIGVGSYTDASEKVSGLSIEKKGKRI